MTAYLKAHWPVEFMAALLSSDIPGRNFKKKDSLVEHLEDCLGHRGAAAGREPFGRGVHGDRSEDRATRSSAIKGCGSGEAAAIVAGRRAGGPYRSLFDFCERLDPSVVNRTAVESLVKAGGFDTLGARRAQNLAAIDRAMQGGAAAAADRRSGQLGLFAEEADQPTAAQPAAGLPDIPEWDPRDRLAKEKEVLGFYMSSHPLAEHQKTLRIYCSHTTVEAAALKNRSEVLLGGMLAAIKFGHTKNPKPGSPSRYAMFDLEDTEGIMRCILWPDLFAICGELVQPDVIRVLRGVVEKRPGSEEANLIVQEVIAMEALASRCTRAGSLCAGRSPRRGEARSVAGNPPRLSGHLPTTLAAVPGRRPKREMG